MAPPRLVPYRRNYPLTGRVVSPVLSRSNVNVFAGTCVNPAAAALVPPTLVLAVTDAFYPQGATANYRRLQGVFTPRVKFTARPALSHASAIH